MLKNRFLLKWLFLIAILYEAFTCSAFAQTPDSIDYFPLKIGNYWYYYTWPLHSFMKLDVSNKQIIDDTTYFILNDLPTRFEDSLYRKDDSGNVFIRIQNKDFLFFKMTSKTGDSTIITIYNRNFIIKTISASFTASSDFGRIPNCKMFRFYPLPLSYDTDKTYTFAPRIGLIEYRSNPSEDFYLYIRKASINEKGYGSLKVKASYSYPLDPLPVNESIKIEFNLPVDSLEFTKNFRILSKDGVPIPMRIKLRNSNTYFISATNGFNYNDTITMILSGELKDLYNDKLDGNRNGISEGSPKDDYTVVFMTEKLSGIKTNEIQKPIEFMLFKNYPNPFNPSTNIYFDLPFSSFVTLKIYDVLGKEVRTLISEYHTAGKHTVNFDASNLAGGVYYCKLSFNNKEVTKKLLYMK